MAPRIHVKKGDTVMVITGKDAGKKGKVLSVIPKTSRVIVEGVNVVKRHTKPSQKLPQGGIREMEASVHSSNVLLFCSKCNKPARMGHKISADGSKTRVCKKCGEAQGK